MKMTKEQLEPFFVAELGAEWSKAGHCPFCGAAIFSHPTQGVAHTGPVLCTPFMLAVTGRPTVTAQLESISLHRN